LIILVRPKPLQRDRPTGLEVVVRFCITIGMLGAIVASALGWANAWFAIATGDRAVLLDQHRILGTVTALAAVGVWLNSERLARRPETSRWPLRIALLITCVLVGLAGHWGGMLVYGRDYYTW
jgi:uncharacterized membrane protein